MLSVKTQGNTIKCLACSHYCVIPEGRSGLCGVRENIGGRLELLIYGRPCAINIDPIEKKPLYHFLPGTRIFSLGTFGCNFGCSYCQNWNISQASRKGALQSNWRVFLSSLEYWPPEKVVEFALKENLPAIAFTYNEPAIWAEYACDISRLARKNGLKSVYVSNGYMSSEAIEYISPNLDAINIDIKSFSQDFYRKTCQARIEPVFESIRKFIDKGVWVEVTTLLVPRLNDSEEEIRQIANSIKAISPDLPWHLTAFHGDYRMQDHESTPFPLLLKAKEIGQEAGLNYVYIGRARAGEHAHTYCPSCNELLVERGHMWGRVLNMSKGKCVKCGTKIPGVFD